MPYLVAERSKTDENLWNFRGVFGTRKKARETLGEGSFLYKEIEFNTSYSEGIILEDLAELK
jgi:hypothetical protein